MNQVNLTHSYADDHIQAYQLSHTPMRSPTPSLLSHIHCLIKLYCAAPCNKIPSLFQEAKCTGSLSLFILTFLHQHHASISKSSRIKAQGGSSFLHCTQACKSMKVYWFLVSYLPSECCSHCRQSWVQIFKHSSFRKQKTEPQLHLSLSYPLRTAFSQEKRLISHCWENVNREE